MRQVAPLAQDAHGFAAATPSLGKGLWRIRCQSILRSYVGVALTGLGWVGWSFDKPFATRAASGVHVIVDAKGHTNAKRIPLIAERAGGFGRFQAVGNHLSLHRLKLWHR